jgi:hypothetical protein
LRPLETDAALIELLIGIRRFDRNLVSALAARLCNAAEEKTLLP